MIIVKNRELIIPREEFNIGTNYDSNAETREFKIHKVTSGGIDLTTLDFFLEYELSDGSSDSVSLVKEEQRDGIHLIWTIDDNVLGKTGTVLVQITALSQDENNSKTKIRWASFKGAFFVEDTLHASVQSDVDRHVDIAESWATGTKRGVEVPSSDQTYHNNSKYYAEQSKSDAIASTASAQSAALSVIQAQNVVSDTNSRFDNAVSAITTDTEVIDIRFGYDGKTYESAGQAVREQFSNLSRDLTQLNINVKQHGASGSAESTVGNISNGSNTVSLLDIKDFKVGDGVIISGAGASCREVISLVLESEPKSTGNMEFLLPNESGTLIYAQAKKEVVTITVNGSANKDGSISVIVDGINYEINISNGDNEDAIASKIRGFYFEGWSEYDESTKTYSNGGSGNVVILTAQTAGNRRRTLVYDNGIGATFNIAYDKGILTTPQDLCNVIRQKTYSNWDVAGYNDSNVVFFISKNDGTTYKEGIRASFNSGSTGVDARIEYVQYGSFLVSEITRIDGRNITLSDYCTNTLTAVYIGHDDTKKIKQCIELAKGKQLFFPAGTYNISDEIKPFANTRIVGESTGSVLNFHKIGINGMRFDKGSDNCVVENLKFKNVCAPDAYFDSAVGSPDSEFRGVWINSANHITVKNCIFDNCDDAGVAENYAEYSQILNNVIKNTSEGSGIELLKTKYSFVQGNIVEYSSQHGIRVCGAIEPKVIGNTVRFNEDGISVQSYSDDVTILQKTCKFIVSDNHIGECITNGIVIFNQSNDGLVTGNHIDKTLNNTENTGIYIKFNSIVNTVHDISINQNTIKGYPRCVYIDGSCRNIFFNNNKMYPWRDGETSDFAVNMNNYSNGDIANVCFENNIIISECLNKYGIRLFTGSPRTLVNVHNNTFIMRITSNENIQNHAVYNVAQGTYPNIFISKHGSIDTNNYIAR